MKEIIVQNGEGWLFAKVDDDIYDKLSCHCWRISSGYAERYKRFGCQRMHLEVVGPIAKGSIVHHLNGDRLDNRKVNLAVIQKHYHKGIHSKSPVKAGKK
jgi:hypothetical protein